MTSRPLRAVLVPPKDASGRLFDALAAALDGTGPAILPLDPSLPRSRLDELITAFSPGSIQTPEGVERLAPVGAARKAGPGEGGSGVADDVAVVLATSGSTGRPKAAELSAAALLASARASLHRLGAEPGQRWLCCLPTHHISGLAVLVRSLVCGTTPIVSDRVDADIAGLAKLARLDGLSGPAEQAGQGTAGPVGYVSLVPTQLRRLLDAGAPVQAFRAILLGGAAIPDGMLEEAAAVGARVVTSYGMTETCGGCVYDGAPLDGVQVAGGQDGRIRITGPVLFSRYRLEPELTRAALADGWFVTSDLGGLGVDGKLVLRGRADDVINSGGEKIVAAEVERTLRSCPGVRDAVVVGIADPQWGERVTAVVVAAHAADPPSLAQLREHVAGQLPRYAAPQALVVVAQLPLLASGKPDRQLLKRIAAERS